MDAGEFSSGCNFVPLFSSSFPHILEKIFFSLDYESYKNCLEVCNEWKGVLTSDRYKTKGRSVFKEEIGEDEKKLSTAVRQDNRDEVRMLLASGMINVDCKCGYGGNKPLHAAAGGGLKEVAELLIESGAEVNKSGYRGRTPLHFAAINGQKEVSQLLIEHGADPNVVNNYGSTPLHLAARNGHKEVTKLLIERGTDMDKADNDGYTPRKYMHWL